MSMLFPIKKAKTYPCVMHCKLRNTEKLSVLLCSKAVEQGVEGKLLHTIHKSVEEGGLGLDNVRVSKCKDTGKVAISTLYGHASDMMINNGEVLCGLCGESNMKRVAGDKAKLGDSDPLKKTKQQLLHFFQQPHMLIFLANTNTDINQASKEDMQQTYLDATEGHVCGGSCGYLGTAMQFKHRDDAILMQAAEWCLMCSATYDKQQVSVLRAQRLDKAWLAAHLKPKPGCVFFCPISMESYTWTGRQNDVTQIWRLWGLIDARLRQLTALTDAEIDTLEANIDKFGVLFLAVYGAENVTAYIHIMCCHMVNILRGMNYKSLGIYANQGVECAHKEIRQLLNFTARGE